MAEVETEEKVPTLEEIAVTSTKLLSATVKRALTHQKLDAGERVEQDVRNALLLTSLLKELAELRALRG